MYLEIEKRFFEVCKRLRMGYCADLYWDLFDRYSQEHRAYHTIVHIESMFHELDRSSIKPTDASAIEIAIWYHDAIYDTKAHDNEERSAELFRNFFKNRNCSIPNKFLARVVSLILATKHAEQSSDSGVQLLCDLDLSILGQTESVFDGYERQIRKEYDWVPEPDFIKGRSTMLQSFLDRSHIYSTEFFREKYEEQARKNLTRSIAQLSGRLQF